MDLVVVDGPNLFNTIASNIDCDDDLLRFYLEDCLDFDLLVERSLVAFGHRHQPLMGIVIFHSRRALGRGAYRLSNGKLDEFWARQGSNPNTSTFTVDIPGDQQDTYIFECGECGHPNHVATRAEKGIDTSITTYLMETLESWRSLCLVSRDVDYAPLVATLRRKGKLVYVAVSPNEPATALVRAAQSTVTLDLDFIRHDIAVAHYLKSGGILDELVRILGQNEDLEFAVDVVRENSVSIGIIHPPGASARVIEIMSQVLEKFGVDFINIDQHNNRLLKFRLNRDSSVDRKLRRLSSGPAWLQYEGHVRAP